VRPAARVAVRSAHRTARSAVRVPAVDRPGGRAVARAGRLGASPGGGGAPCGCQPQRRRWQGPGGEGCCGCGQDRGGEGAELGAPCTRHLHHHHHHPCLAPSTYLQCVSQSVAATTQAGERLWGARWRLVVLAGLLVGPFFPASNVLFYVGTFIGGAPCGLSRMCLLHVSFTRCTRRTALPSTRRHTEISGCGMPPQASGCCISPRLATYCCWLRASHWV
jgi:hypothetical protein